MSLLTSWKRKLARKNFAADARESTGFCSRQQDGDAGRGSNYSCVVFLWIGYYAMNGISNLETFLVFGIVV